jgi:4-hydroxy-3-polyprenylbenzoate decarboxylase
MKKRLMTLSAEMGAHILPPVPSFYHQPKTIQDIIDQTIGKVFDSIGIEHLLFKRWENYEHEERSSDNCWSTEATGPAEAF